FSPAAESVHFGLTAKYQLTTGLVRLRVWGDAACGMGEGFADCMRRKQPSPPASPYPLPSEMAVITCAPCIKLAEEVGRFPLNRQIASRILGILDGIRIQICGKADRFPL